MIISASRRTDIPAFYAEWFANRIKEEYVLVRSLVRRNQVRKIDLSPEVVDGIVFWTKNPEPMLKHLSALEKYPYYFQITLTAYDRDVEPNLPSKNNVILPAIRDLMKAIGRERVVWRYDPILFNDRYTMEYHCKYFRNLAAKLSGCTEKCTVSFLKSYKKIEKNVESLNAQEGTFEMQCELMQKFAEIGKEYGLTIDACAEKIDFQNLGISPASCIDKRRLERIGNCQLNLQKDLYQRPECGCVDSIDIGAYDCCGHGCLYCYANTKPGTAKDNLSMHDPNSPLLLGNVGRGDVMIANIMESNKVERTVGPSPRTVPQTFEDLGLDSERNDMSETQGAELQEITSPDMDAVRALYHSVGWTNYTLRPEMLRNAFQHSLWTLGAYEDGKLVGLVRCVGDGYSVVLVQDLLVEPAYQRQGIGTRLMQAVLQRYEQVYQLELFTDDSPKTIAFYRSLGLKEVSRFGCCGFVRYQTV